MSGDETVTVHTVLFRCRCGTETESYHPDFICQGCSAEVTIMGHAVAVKYQRAERRA